MVKFPSFLLCSALAAFALFLVVDARLLGCKGGLDCLNPEMASSPKYKDEKVSAVPPEHAKGVKPSEGGRSADLYGSGLRWVPSGPDPLHHNGDPKKPQTP